MYVYYLRPSGEAVDEKLLDQFRAEAAILASLRHPNLVQVYAFGREGGDAYFVMELVEGQSAGEAIGADTLLLRIGAYYHDIGKMMNPNLFIENQFEGENPHDVLEPRESARIIIKHVRHGMRIGQEAGLPKVVGDLIVQHHGTQLMEYFYNIAAKTYPKSTIQEEEFRYPGPKTQSVEAAVLMLADAVEAASRSIQDPNRKKFRKMVRLIMFKRIVDGQFSDCDLSTRDLTKVVDALVDALEASFHSRVRYPWQGKGKKVVPKKTDWQIGADTGNDREDPAFRL